MQDKVTFSCSLQFNCFFVILKRRLLKGQKKYQRLAFEIMITLTKENFLVNKDQRIESMSSILKLALQGCYLYFIRKKIWISRKTAYVFSTSKDFDLSQCMERKYPFHFLFSSLMYSFVKEKSRNDCFEYLILHR